MTTARHRTIWLSDIHLGTRGCNARALLDFLDTPALAHEASRRDLQGVVCGHIQRAEMREIAGVLYWLESCTALIEDIEGRLELLRMEPAAVAGLARRRVATAS